MPMVAYMPFSEFAGSLSRYQQQRKVKIVKIFHTIVLSTLLVLTEALRCFDFH
jgi:hypothetical protein